MISKTGAVKVMDFGIARALADANSVTQTAAVIGTAQYLSPEQARGEKVDARSDVYSLGCVLYEILTGEPPFTGDSPSRSPTSTCARIRCRRRSATPASPPELDAVVLKALAKNPDNRYQTAAEMRADLVRVHSGEAPEAPKVLTDAERTSLLSSTPSQHRTEPIDTVERPQPGYADKDERGGSVGRWLIAVAVLAVLTVVVTIAINMFGGSTRDVQVPDVSGQASRRRDRHAAERRLQDAHAAEAGLDGPARSRHRHRPGAPTRPSARATRSPSTCPPAPSSARSPTCTILTYADCGPEAHRRRASASSSSRTSRVDAGD